ncbi:MAG: Sec-independent protein translocase subunit TatA [Ornithinibacter sp.]
MLRNFGPTEIIIIAVLLIVIFGWKKLPDAARSLGRSARVFKSEVDEMKRETEANKSGSEAAGETVRSESIEADRPGERIVSTPVDRAMPTTDGNAVHEKAPRTDNQSGPVA